MELVKQKSQQLAKGEVSIHDVGRELKLTANQISFAIYYCSSEIFGNGKAAYALAYNLDLNNKSESAQCSSGASAMLRHATVLTLIDILLDGEGLNDSFADKQLLYLMTQNADLKAKSLAVKEYNNLKGRIKNQQMVTIQHQYDVTLLNDTQLATLIALADRAKLGSG